MKPTTTYIPGICNINHSEIKKRRLIGIIGLVLVFIFVVMFMLINIPFLFRTAIFIPAFLMSTGFLQAKNKFCVGFASAGIQHTEDETEKIIAKEAIALDKARAKKMNTHSALIAAGITSVYLLISLFFIYN